jgi:RNA polymerase sigma-70 factor (ECF subfamily)
MKTALEHAIQSLPRNQRTVYLLREVQNLSVADTAAHLNLSPANVKVLLHRAREQLKVRLLQSATGVELFAYSARYCDPLTAKVMHAVMTYEET